MVISKILYEPKVRSKFIGLNIRISFCHIKTIGLLNILCCFPIYAVKIMLLDFFGSWEVDLSHSTPHRKMMNPAANNSF